MKYISLNLKANALYKGVGDFTPKYPSIKKPVTNTKRSILKIIVI